MVLDRTDLVGTRSAASPSPVAPRIELRGRGSHLRLAVIGALWASLAAGFVAGAWRGPPLVGPALAAPDREAAAPRVQARAAPPRHVRNAWDSEL